MRIGIVGASSQVGSSVALYLKKYLHVEVICFVRSGYSKAFFDLVGITIDDIDVNNKPQLKSKFSQLDAIIDFSYPSGQLFEIKASLKISIENIISCLPPQATYIYMSSIMAYGMSAEERYVGNYFFPRSTYAFLKRYAEKIVRRFGRKYSIKVYNFRLGQVHGVLQSVNSSFREKLSKNNIAFVNGGPSELTNTVFVNSVSDAILECVKGKEIPGTYTLISSPQWSLKELYDYYVQYYNFPIEIIYAPEEKKKIRYSFGVFGFLRKYRPLLETYFLMNLPRVLIKVKGRYRESEASGLGGKSIADGMKYIDFNLLGKPGNKVISTNSSVSVVNEKEREFENYYLKLLDNNRV